MTNHTKTQRAVKLAAGPLLLVAIAICALRSIHSYDVFWYLRSGEEILRTGGIPARDTFSYASGPSWLNHEWLAEVVLYGVHRAAGFAGLAVMVALVIAGIAAVVLGRRSLSVSSGVALATMGAILAELAEPRAQLFSWLIFAAVGALCLRDLERPSRVLLFVLPLQVLWSNVHGGNPNGVGLVGLLFLAQPSWRRFGVGVAMAALTLANPYGWHVHAHFLGSSGSLPEIREWQPLGQVLVDGSLPHILFAALVVFAVLCLRLSRDGNAGRRFEVMALLFFTFLAARYVRFTGEAAIAAAVMVVRNRPAMRMMVIGRSDRAQLEACITAVGLALSVLLLASTAAASDRAFQAGLSPGRFPVEAAAWLKTNNVPGPMFNSYNFGGFLLWSNPSQPVYIDGRAFIIYPREHFDSLVTLYKSPASFRALESRWGFRSAVVQRTGRGEAFVSWLRKQPDWYVAYEAGCAAVFMKR